MSRTAATPVATRREEAPRLASVVLPQRRRQGGSRVPTPSRARPGTRTAARSGRRRRKASRSRRAARGAVPVALSLPRLVAASLAGVFGLLVALLWMHPAFRVEKVQVQGLVRTDPTRLQNWTGFANVVGQPAVAVRPEDLVQRVREAFPEFRRVSVYVGFPNRVLLVVEERDPVLVWIEGRETFWMDEEGVVFYPSGAAEPTWPRVKVMGDEPGVRPSPEQVRLLLSLAQKVGSRELVYHPEYGVGWRAPEGWQVYLGHALHDWEARWQLYQALRNVLLEKNQRPEVIRLLSTRAVVVLPEAEEEGQQP